MSFFKMPKFQDATKTLSSAKFLFDEFVGSFDGLEIFVMNFVWFCFNHLPFIYNDMNGLVFLMVCII